MLIENTRNLINKVKLLMESKYNKLLPLKWTSNKFIHGKTFFFEKKDENNKFSYSLTFSSSSSLLKLTTSDINYKKTIENFKDNISTGSIYLITFKAFMQKGKIYQPFEDEVNLTIAKIIQNFVDDTDYEPSMFILDPIAEEKYIDTDLIDKKLSNNWIKETYLDVNDSITYLFIKIK